MIIIIIPATAAAAAAATTTTTTTTIITNAIIAISISVAGVAAVPVRICSGLRSSRSRSCGCCCHRRCCQLMLHVATDVACYNRCCMVQPMSFLCLQLR